MERLDHRQLFQWALDKWNPSHCQGTIHVFCHTDTTATRERVLMEVGQVANRPWLVSSLPFSRSSSSLLVILTMYMYAV